MILIVLKEEGQAVNVAAVDCNEAQNQLSDELRKDLNPNSTEQGQNPPLPPVFCVLLKKSSLQPIVKLICKFLLHICGDPPAFIWAKKLISGHF